MRVIRRISAVIIGFVFFIAGVLKLMDPVGAGLVVDEYLKFFHLNFLHFAWEFIACALALIETIIGAALITGVWRKIIAIISLIFTGFFTLITLILLIFNPNMDCGCFGEIIHLSHLESFIKNIVLLGLWALAFLPFRKIEPSRKVKYVSFGIASVSVGLFLMYSLLSLPLVDFTSLRQGAELEDSQTYLSFSNVAGEYVDDLAYNQRVMVISAYTPEKLKERNWERITELLLNAESAGYTPLLLLASSPENLDSNNKDVLLQYSYFADRKTLMTLNRSNGGATYLADGQIIAKWAVHKFPKEDKLVELAAQDTTEALIELNNASNLKLQGFLLYVFAVMLLL